MRTKHSVSARKRKKKIFKLTKGFWGKRKNVLRRAKETLRRALVYSYRDRRQRKREFRRLWIARINAAVREKGLTYKEFIHGLKEKNIKLSRNILAHLASEDSQVFEKLIELVKK